MSKPPRAERRMSGSAAVAKIPETGSEAPSHSRDFEVSELSLFGIAGLHSESVAGKPPCVTLTELLFLLRNQ